MTSHRQHLLALLAGLLISDNVAAVELPTNTATRALAELEGVVSSSLGPVDERVYTTLLTAKWPEESMPTVRALLMEVLEEPSVQLSSNAVEVFAMRNGADGKLLIPYLAHAIPEAEPGDAVRLLRAARAIGPQASSLEHVVHGKCSDSNTVVVIHASSTLIRLAPTLRYPRDILLRYLSNSDPGCRWRAAHAIARCGETDQRWEERLAKLCSTDDDVRVQVTSAYALWRTTDDLATTLPVLVKSLAHPDTSLSTAFEYPSYPGDSHRVYALQAIIDMGEQAKEALPYVIAVVHDVADAKVRDSTRLATLGIVALNAIKSIGPVSRAQYKEIEASVNRRDCPFKTVRDGAHRIMSAIGCVDAESARDTSETRKGATRARLGRDSGSTPDIGQVDRDAN